MIGNMQPRGNLPDEASVEFQPVVLGHRSGVAAYLCTYLKKTEVVRCGVVAPGADARVDKVDTVVDFVGIKIDMGTGSGGTQIGGRADVGVDGVESCDVSVREPPSPQLPSVSRGGVALVTKLVICSLQFPAVRCLGARRTEVG